MSSLNVKLIDQFHILRAQKEETVVIPKKVVAYIIEEIQKIKRELERR